MPHAINEHVLMRKTAVYKSGNLSVCEVTVTVNARHFIMFVTRHHAKHMLNYEYLTAAGILHSLLT